MGKKNVHDGHRERMREKYRCNGLSAMPDHEKMEMLLFYGIPRCNTNETAHRLLNRFGTIGAVINAPEELLLEVKGIGKGGGTFFRFLRDIYGLYDREHSADKRKITTPAEAADEFFNLYTTVSTESLCMVVLDTKFRILFAGEVCKGGLTSVDVSIRKLVQVALAYNSTSIIIGHCHPSGIMDPSAEDISATAAIEQTLGGLNIELLDHIIISQEKYISLAERGLLLHQKQLWRGLGPAGIGATYQ